LPTQLKAVWNLRLYAGSEGPALISNTALRSRLTPFRIRDTPEHRKHYKNSDALRQNLQPSNGGLWSYPTRNDF
ncbi:MAG: hypothetical protein FWD67_06570, partial [Betaproteobacteria bacterium]|nr:hypothetical protein [Betaproteobacteria bacterium]